MEKSFDVIVVGAGISGLVAAGFAAKQGARVLVVDKASHPGGRARTTEKQGFLWNIGPHALYVGGAAWSAVTALGVSPKGTTPTGGGALAVQGTGADRTLRTMPSGPLSILTTGLMSLSGKIAMARAMVGMKSLDPKAFSDISATAWIDSISRSLGARSVMRLYTMIATYTADLDRLPASVAISQLQRVLTSGVMYLDGGWETLVTGLLRVTRELGVTVHLGQGVERVRVAEGRVAGVHLANGATIDASAVVLAVLPRIAAHLVPGNEKLRSHADRALPIEVACLDMGFDKLPRPERKLAFGLDRPTYFSVHSAFADLAPAGKSTAHAMLYVSGPDSAADEAELRSMVELIQPGHAAHLAEERFLPKMTVMCDRPIVGRGFACNAPDDTGVAGLFVAGDWVGPDHLLADAACASGKTAGERAAKQARSDEHLRSTAQNAAASKDVVSWKQAPTTTHAGLAS